MSGWLLFPLSLLTSCSAFFLFEQFLAFWHSNMLQLFFILYPHPWDQSFLQRGPNCFQQRVTLETKILELGVLIATRMSLLLALSTQEIPVCIITHAHTVSMFCTYHLNLYSNQTRVSIDVLDSNPVLHGLFTDFSSLLICEEYSYSSEKHNCTTHHSTSLYMDSSSKIVHSCSSLRNRLGTVFVSSLCLQPYSFQSKKHFQFSEAAQIPLLPVTSPICPNDFFHLTGNIGYWFEMSL